VIKTGAQLMRRRLDAIYSGNNGRTGFLNFNGSTRRGTERKVANLEGF
jgi:hypothetical protein